MAGRCCGRVCAEHSLEVVPLRERARPEAKARVAPPQAVHGGGGGVAEAVLRQRRRPARLHRKDVLDTAVLRLKLLKVLPQLGARLRRLVCERVLECEARIVYVARAACTSPALSRRIASPHCHQCETCHAVTLAAVVSAKGTGLCCHGCLPCVPDV